MKYFQNISLQKFRFHGYKKFGTSVFNQCLQMARGLKQANIIHISSTAQGGGVAELLKTQVPLERDLGLNSRWLVIQQPTKFFFVTKKIHNLLQGQKGFLSEPEQTYYFNQLRGAGLELAKLLNQKEQKTVVILHDPQVLPLANYLPAHVSLVARLHMDLSAAGKPILNFLKPLLIKADKVVVSHKAYRPKWLKLSKTVVSFPAISPFADKNRTLSSAESKKIMRQKKISLAHPLVVQVSRFDPWKDPEGVIDSYYLAKKRIPRLQLVLEGSRLAQDDPESALVYQKLKMQHPNDPDLFLLDYNKPDEIWINALQRSAWVVLQKSLREGFGLTVTEALWKSKAVIGGDTLGIRLQIKNGYNGFIVKSPAECARRIVQLINNPKLAAKLGGNGYKTVKEKFLFNRLIFDFLKIYRQT